MDKLYCKGKVTQLSASDVVLVIKRYEQTVGRGLHNIGNERVASVEIVFLRPNQDVAHNSEYQRLSFIPSGTQEGSGDTIFWCTPLLLNSLLSFICATCGFAMNLIESESGFKHENGSKREYRYYRLTVQPSLEAKKSSRPAPPAP